MNAACPDWPALAAARDAAGEDSVEWRAAREHLRGCRACRAEALAAEPALLFADLGPRAELADADVVAMQRDVAALVRAARVRQAPLRRPWRVAAALLLAAGALALGPGAPEPARLAAPAVRSLVPALAETEFAAQPLLDDLDLPQARLVELRSDDVAVVLVVDASLDV